jgi:hypothetical protein
MKGNGYERHYKDIAPPKSGLFLQKANPTKMVRNKSKVGFNCDYCEIPFEKYACWAKRTSHHYCGRACAWAAKVVRIPKDCVVCGTEMMLTPTDHAKIATCSKPCLRKKRVVNNDKMRSSPDYTAIVKRLKKNAICKLCATTKGPWVAKGVKLWVEGGLSCADGSEAYLTCRHCHLKSVFPQAMASTYMNNRVKYYKEQK